MRERLSRSNASTTRADLRADAGGTCVLMSSSAMREADIGDRLGTKVMDAESSQAIVLAHTLGQIDHALVFFGR